MVYPESYSLVDIMEMPNRLKSLPLYSQLDYMEKAAESKELFSNYLKTICLKFPHVFSRILSGFHSNVVPLSLIFRDELETLPVHLKTKNSEINLFHLFSELDEYVDSGNIANAAFRKRIIDRAIGCLSDEDFQFFRRILSQDVSEKAESLIEEMWKDNDFPEEYARNFMFFYKKDAEPEAQKVLFSNSSRTEQVCYFMQEPSRFMIKKNLFIRLNESFQPVGMVLPEEDEYSKIYAISRGRDTFVLLTDFDGAFCAGDQNGVWVMPNTKNRGEYVESALCDILTRKPFLIFVLDKNGKVEYSYKRTDELKENNIKMDSFEIMDCPFTGGQYRILNCSLEGGEVCSIVGRADVLDTMGKNKKNISFVEFNGTKYLTS